MFRKTYLSVDQRVRAQLPYSQVAVRLRVADTVMHMALTAAGMVQLFDAAGRAFSIPITASEAGIMVDDGGHWVSAEVPGIDYDGRYDGPDYSHPFWPGWEPTYCAVCGADIDGRDREGKGFPQGGNPHFTGAGGFDLVVTLTGDRAGEVTLTCPVCRSNEVVVTIAPGVCDTGPGGTCRMSGPGGRQVCECKGCGNTEPRYLVAARTR